MGKYKQKQFDGNFKNGGKFPEFPHCELGFTFQATIFLQINGNCGEALSCGIIARSAGIFENAKRICACDGVTLWDERNKPLVGPERQTKL